MGEMHEKPDHVTLLEQWMKSYRPEELFDDDGCLRPELAALAPSGERRMGANPHANGGMLMKSLRLPEFRDYAIEVQHPGSVAAEATRVQGKFIRDVMKLNLQVTQLPHLQPRRKCLEPLGRRVRSHQPRLRGRHLANRRPHFS